MLRKNTPLLDKNQKFPDRYSYFFSHLLYPKLSFEDLTNLSQTSTFYQRHTHVAMENEANKLINGHLKLLIATTGDYLANFKEKHSTGWFNNLGYLIMPSSLVKELTFIVTSSILIGVLLKYFPINPKNKQAPSSTTEAPWPNQIPLSDAAHIWSIVLALFLLGSVISATVKTCKNYSLYQMMNIFPKEKLSEMMELIKKNIINPLIYLERTAVDATEKNSYQNILQLLKENTAPFLAIDSMTNDQSLSYLNNIHDALNKLHLLRDEKNIELMTFEDTSIDTMDIEQGVNEATALLRPR